MKAAKDRIVSPEAVIEAAPELILASWCGKKVVPEKIRQRPGWDAIPAVRNNRLVEIKSPLILQPGTRRAHRRTRRNLCRARRGKMTAMSSSGRRDRHRACRRQIEPHGRRRQGAAAAWRTSVARPCRRAPARRRSRRSCSTPMTIRLASRRLDWRSGRGPPRWPDGPACRHPCWACLGQGEPAGESLRHHCRRRHAFLPRRSCEAALRGDEHDRPEARRGAVGERRASGVRALAGVACASSRGRRSVTARARRSTSSRRIGRRRWRSRPWKSGGGRSIPSSTSTGLKISPRRKPC